VDISLSSLARQKHDGQWQPERQLGTGKGGHKACAWRFEVQAAAADRGAPLRLKARKSRVWGADSARSVVAKSA
jgi:hypothetical protein